MSPSEQLINDAFEERHSFSAENAPSDIQQTVQEVLAKLDSGEYRVAEKIRGEWHTHQWIKKAVLLSFRLFPNQIFNSGFTQHYDKVPLKYANATPNELKSSGIRIVPPSCVRKGS